MARRRRIAYLPSQFGGIYTGGEEGDSKVLIQPEHVLIFTVILVAVISILRLLI